MGLNIGNIVLTKLFGDKPVELNCMATDFAVTNGLMRTRIFVVDTDEAVITADGTVNLADEQLDLTLRPANQEPAHLLAARAAACARHLQQAPK